MRATNDKSGRPDHENNRNLALKGESLQPKQLEGKLSSGDAELQRKMKAASKEFVEIYHEFEDSVFDLTPAPGTQFAEAYEQHQTKVWGDYLYCTPSDAIMLRLGREWIKVTKENVEEASKEVAEDEDVSPEFYAKIALREVRRWAKKAERVGWVLPRLENGVVSQ